MVQEFISRFEQWYILQFGQKFPSGDLMFNPDTAKAPGWRIGFYDFNGRELVSFSALRFPG